MHLDGERLREARERAGMTQVELADSAETTEATINRLEKGHHQPRIGTIRKIAKALNVAISDLVTWDSDKERA